MPGPRSMGAALVQAAVLMGGSPVAETAPPPAPAAYAPYIGWLNAYERRYRDHAGLPLDLCTYRDETGLCALTGDHSEPWHVREDGLGWYGAPSA